MLVQRLNPRKERSPLRTLLCALSIVTVILAASLPFPAAAAVYGVFPDVTGRLAGDILKAHEVGLVSGYPDGTFRPNLRVTRAAFAKMLVLAVEKATGQEIPVDGGEPFTDVDSSRALYAYVVKAYQSGFIKGYSNGTFGYDKPISRAEAAVILQRSMSLEPSDESFVDVSQDDWYAGAVGAVSDANIMYGDRWMFYPREPLTRGQAAAIAYRAYNYLYQKLHPPLGSKDNPAPIGTKLSLGTDWQVEVVGIDDDAWPEIAAAWEYNPPPASGYRYVMARIRLTYVGNAGWGIPSSVNFDYLDSNNVVSTADCVSVVPDELDEMPSLEYAGAAVEGNVCWAVRDSSVKGGTIVIRNYQGEVYFQGVR